MKIYDGFAFFNELDLLELRLRELWDVVDHFIIVEATRSFQKQPKPLFFQENRARFREFESKIIHVVVDKYPTFWTKLRPVNAWHYDNHQKEGILQGLKNAAPDDLVIVSDLDEIPLAAKVREYQNKPGIRVFEQYQSHYYLNYVCTRMHDYGGKAIAQRNHGGYGRWRGSVMLEKKLIKSIKETRNYRDEESARITVIPEGGWHFSYMGGVEKIMYKVQSYAHSENDIDAFNNREKVVQNVLEGRGLFGEDMRFELTDVASSSLPFPKDLREHPERWKQMLKTPAELRSELSRAIDQSATLSR